jgi:hypothetical protein
VLFAAEDDIRNAAEKTLKDFEEANPVRYK